jgi:predicted metal-dependent peptidase
MTDQPQEMPDEATCAKLTKKLAKAKTNLVLQHPFVGTVAMNMPFSLSLDVPTAGTNGSWVKFNPHFLGTLTDEETTFLVAHECFHPMLEHCYRRHERTPRRWNHAGDYVINYLLTEEKIGKMPADGLLSKGIYDDGGGTTDGIYAVLPEEQEGDEGNYQGEGSGMDNCMDGEGTQQDRDQQAAEMKVRVAQAAQAAKMMGKLSANMERLVDEVLNPKVDWRDVLQQFVEKCKNDIRSWARPNRRFIQQGLYLPTLDGEAMGELVVAVDCSGSVGDEELAQFKGELRAIFEDQKPKRLHTIFFESKVCGYDVLDRDDEFDFNPRGCGGTAFSPIFAKIAEENIEPVACVVLTDLYCNDFGDEPEYPVMWVSYGAEEHPWGELVKM